MRQYTLTCEELRSRANDLEQTAALAAPEDGTKKERDKAVEDQLAEAGALRQAAANRECL